MSNDRVNDEPSGPFNASTIIWCAMLGALLAVFNSIVATVGLGLAQGPIVAFSTPLILTVAKARDPRFPMSATLTYLPVVLLSFFTLNLGPPGVYKVAFILVGILYDLAAFPLLAAPRLRERTWPYVVACSVAFPLGLLGGALTALKLWGISLPLLGSADRSAIAAVAGALAFFFVVSILASWLGARAGHRLRNATDD